MLCFKVVNIEKYCVFFVVALVSALRWSIELQHKEKIVYLISLNPGNSREKGLVKIQLFSVYISLKL